MNNEKLIKHIETHPNDSQAKIALITRKSNEIYKRYELERIRKQERRIARQRKADNQV